jgi:hypothetical protein
LNHFEIPSKTTYTMSQEYKGQDLRDIAAKAEQDLADPYLKHGAQDGGFGGKTVHGGSVSSKLTPPSPEGVSY